MADSQEVPFYDRDGEHWITLEIEFDANGTPPEMIEIAKPEGAKRQMRCQYQRQPQRDPAQPWAYVEISRTWRGEPVPGSAEALRRLRESSKWPP